MQQLGGENGKMLGLFLLLIALVGFIYFNRDRIGEGARSFSGNFKKLEISYPLVTERFDCVLKGGSWETSPDTGTTRCVFYYADGGQECEDSDQCQGACFVMDYILPGEELAGECAHSSAQSGCYNEIDRYKATGAISCIQY